MIISEFSYVRLNGSNISHFKNAGYCGLIGDVIEVKISDLRMNSRSLVEVKCDVCGIERQLKSIKYGIIT